MTNKIPTYKKFIMIHALDTPPSWAKGKSISAIVKEVTRWHVVERGWSAVAYAKIIGPTGAVGLGRDLDGDGDVWEETGAGAKGWNKDGIHIALAGGKNGNADDVFSDHYTPKQEIALLKELREIERLSGRTIVPVHAPSQARTLPPTQIGIMGHNQVANKACPCFSVPNWYAGVSKPVKVQQGKPAAGRKKDLWTLILNFLKGLKR
jgi:N-acetylmuramoyl-L-alanine amidase